MANVARALLGVALLLVGLGMYRYARPLGDVSEQLDAIGSTRPTGAVEAADWTVSLIRYVGVFVAVFGFVVGAVAVLP